MFRGYHFVFLSTKQHISFAKWWERCDSNTRSPKAVDLQSTAIAAMRLSHIKPTSSVITNSVSLFYSRGSEDCLLVSSHLVLAGTSSESRTHKQLLLRQAALPICVSKHIQKLTHRHLLLRLATSFALEDYSFG